MSSLATKAVLSAIAVIALAAPAARSDSQAPPRSTIAQRVDRARDIFIGVATQVRVIKLVDGKAQTVSPEPALLEAGESVEITIEPGQVLYPANWQAPKTTLYYFSGGAFNVASVRGHVVNAQLIYPVAIDKDTGVFIPSYPWHLADTIDERGLFQDAIDAREKREQGSKSDGEGK